MTEDQYKRAVEIYNRISRLKDTLKSIEGRSEHRLYFCYKNCSNEYSTCPDWAMDPISDILDRHDLAIRKEIQDEIDSLKKEIESL